MSERKRDAAIVRFITSQPWGILPDALDTIANIVADHIAGLPVTMQASEKAKTVSSVDYPNIAVIDIVGTLSKRLYGLDAISGGETMRGMQERIQVALDDSEVNAIVLKIDSPGGTVDGTKEFADFIKAADKPIVAYADGLMASAAYWIGSAADKIVAFDTAQVGSVGVIIAHHDYSAKLDQAGIKVTHIYAGKYKALGNSAEPLSSESKTYLQDKVDYFYSLFVNAVADHRGVDTKTVLTDMAEGQIFIGQQAKDAGLVDEIGGLDTALRLATELTEGDKMPKTLTEQLKSMSRAEAIKAVADAHGIELSESQLALFEPEVPKVEVAPEVQERLDALEQKLLDAEAKLADKEVKSETEAIHAEVISLLTPYGLHKNESLVALGEELDEDDFSCVVDVVSTMHSKYKILEEKLMVVTEGAHTDGDKFEVPTTWDEAVSMIEKRDKVDCEEAADTATVEFPNLYNKEFGGHNE